MKQIVVLGSINADHVVKVAQFPAPGETCHAHDYQLIPGGKGANQAVACARLNAKTHFISAIGNDDVGRSMKQGFADQGIDTKMIFEQANQSTGLAMIQVTEQGENSICVFAGANQALDDQQVLQAKASLQQADYLLMQLETPLSGVEQALTLTSQMATPPLTVLNPAPAVALPDSILRAIDIITPNETEAQILTGVVVEDEQSAALASDKLHDKGIDIVLITLGAKGVWLSQASTGERQLIVGFRVKAVDTTAAGDTFNGALVCALSEGKSLIQAVRFAQAAAALSVTAFGAQTSIPTRAAVDDFVG